MCALIDRSRRERAQASRQTRRSDCLEAARTLVLSRPWSGVTLDAIASRAGLEKGGAALFFPSREALFAELLRGEVGTALAGAVDACARAETPARAIARAFSGNEVLVRLLSMEPEALAPGVDVHCVRAYYGFLANELEKEGKRLASQIGISDREGALLLHRALLLTSALGSGAGRALAAAIDGSQRRLLEPDIALELESLLVGWANRKL